MASPKNHFKAFFRLAELSETEQTKQFACFPLRTTFIPCYTTLDSKAIHYHVLMYIHGSRYGLDVCLLFHWLFIHTISLLLYGVFLGYKLVYFRATSKKKEDI
jgi:hypothetical protein